MTIGSIFLALALLVLVGLYVARPLIKPVSRSRSRLTTYQALFAQKEAILVQIRSLEFDYNTGKLTDADYHRTREEFMVEAEDIFRRLDELEERGGTVEPASATTATGSTSDFESEIEAAVVRRRSQPAPIAPESSQIQPSVSNGKTRYCPECGRPTDPDDKFCANCGHKLLNPQHA
jgi:hypothetical protein